MSSQLEPSQDRSVVVAVVCFVGAIAVVGLAGLIYLVHDKTDAAALLAISGPTTTAIGILGALLVTTRTNPPPPVEQAQATGYSMAVADLRDLDASGGKPVPDAQS